MSRCKACNEKLTDSELKRRIVSLDKTRVEYAELCTACLRAGDYSIFTIKQGKEVPLLDIEDD